MEPNDDQDKMNTLDLLQRCKSRSTFLPLDLKMSLFSAALHSYRCDSILKPFPNKFITSNKEKLFDEIVCYSSDHFSINSLIHLFIYSF